MHPFLAQANDTDWTRIITYAVIFGLSALGGLGGLIKEWVAKKERKKNEAQSPGPFTTKPPKRAPLYPATRSCVPVARPRPQMRAEAQRSNIPQGTPQDIPQLELQPLPLPMEEQIETEVVLMPDFIEVERETQPPQPYQARPQSPAPHNPRPAQPRRADVASPRGPISAKSSTSRRKQHETPVRKKAKKSVRTQRSPDESQENAIETTHSLLYSEEAAASTSAQNDLGFVDDALLPNQWTRHSLRRAIVLSEVLGPPMALRKE